MSLFKRKKKELDIYKELAENVDWDDLIRSKKFSEEFLDKFFDNINPVNISIYQNLSEDFIRRHADKLNMKCIAQYQILSMKFIREFSYDRDFLEKALYYQSNIDVEFVREYNKSFGKLLENDYLGKHSLTKMDFYEEWKEHVNWWQLNAQHKLTPDFIEKYIEKFNFSSTDRKKLEVDEEHYTEIRIGTKSLSKITMDCKLGCGEGIVFNPSSISWVRDRIPDEKEFRCNSQCDNCKYKEEYENSDWQLDN